MNIRRIIKEEINDFDWTDNMGPLDGVKFRVPRGLANRVVYTIHDDGKGDSVKAVWSTKDGSEYSDTYDRGMVTRYLKDGYWKRVDR